MKIGKERKKTYLCMRKSCLMKKKKKIALCIFLAILASIVCSMVIYAIVRYYRSEVCNFSSNDGESHGYYVYPNQSLDSVVAQMAQDYEIASPRDLRLDSRRMLVTTIRPGYYKFPAKIGNKHLIRRLQMGQESPVRLTFTNVVRTREQLAGRLASQLLIDSTDIISRLEDDTYMARFGMNKETAVCLFLPDTYEVYWSLSADDLFQRMKKEYDRFWTDERRHKADSLHLSPIDVAIVASIVESETHREAEHPAIASLYLNRLRLGMALQACPTVIFATGDLKLRRVLKRHLAIDSPYNTYKYRGLPPGPIRCARKHTMDIVLNAPKTDYLFMCANPDFSGTHIFSAKYGQHTGVAKQYRHALDQRDIQ